MEEEIELKVIQSGASKVEDAFEKLMVQIDKTSNALTKMEKTGSNYGKNIAQSMKQASEEIDVLEKKTNSSLNKMKNFVSIFGSLTIAVGAVKKLSSSFGKMVQGAIDYSEELNLFNVVFKNQMSGIETEFSDVGLEAERFQQKLHEAFGTNLMETRRFQALFQSMGENMGIVTDKAEIMSSNMEKLTYDIASLYNASEEDVGQAIRAGVYAGQTKPLRRFGIDVTQVSMQPIMDELGLEKSISELSQAEKQILRYISVLRQSSVAHGDFANTIESPANQLKILKQQCVEAQIALGNLFVGAYSRLLPYANAVLMVIKEVTKAIASFFGIKVSDYNAGISTSINEYEDLEDTFGGVADSAGGATKAIKELNRQTLKFDQINNIKSPTPPSGSSGGGGGGGSAIGGIDQRLLDALKGYDNGMDKVRMKANEIRDKIMDWLGFTKQIDPLTGEVSWKFEGLKKTIKSLWDHFKKLSFAGKVFMGIGLGAGLVTIAVAGKRLLSVLGVTGLGKAIGALISPTTTLFKLMATGKGTLSQNITEWQKYTGVLDKNGKTVGGLAGIWNKFTNILSGSVLALGGMAVYYESFKSIREEGANLLNVLGSIGGAIATVGGAMTVGATVAGPYGAVIGGLVGAMVLLGETMAIASDKYPQYTKQNETLKKEIQEVTDSYHREIEAIREGTKASLAEVESDKQLAEELMSIVDSNGKVKAGYEDRANFIMGRLNEAYGLEITMTDGIIDNWEKVKNKIFDVIEAKKAQIYFNAYEKEYEQSVLAEKDAQEKLSDAVKKRNGAMSELGTLQERANSLAERNKEITDELNNSSDMLSYKRKQLTDELIKNTKELEANSAKQTDLNNQIKDFDTNVTNATKTYVEATNTQSKYGEIWVAQQAGNWAEVERLYKEGSDKTTKTFRDNLIKQAQAVESGSEIPTQIIEGFRVLAFNSEKQYNNALSKLPEDTRTQIDNAVKETEAKKKTVYGKSFELGEQVKKGHNTATKGLADETTLEYTGKLTSKKNKDKVSEAGKSIGKTTMDNIKSETNKGVDVKVRANTNGVTRDVNNAVNNWGNGYKIDVYPNVKGNGQLTYTPKKALGGVFSNGIWKNIKQYASGGLPSHGTMFTAGERGPEIVGHIGRRTEVLNQSQLASVMFEAVSRALSTSDFGGIAFYAHTDEGVVIDKINRITRQTGQCPIEV